MLPLCCYGHAGAQAATTVKSRPFEFLVGVWMAAQGFFIDQGVFGCLYVVFLVLNILELVIEHRVLAARRLYEDWKRRNSSASVSKRSRGDAASQRILRNYNVGHVQIFYHRLGLLMCIIGTLLYIDPYGAHDIYSPNTQAYLRNNIGALLIVAANGAFYLPINLQYLITFNREAPKVQKYSLIALAILPFLGANLTVRPNVGYAKATFLFLLTFVEFCDLIIVNWAMWKLSKAFEQLARTRMTLCSPTSPVAASANPPTDTELSPRLVSVSPNDSDVALVGGSSSTGAAGAAHDSHSRQSVSEVNAHVSVNVSRVSGPSTRGSQGMEPSVSRHNMTIVENAADRERNSILKPLRKMQWLQILANCILVVAISVQTYFGVVEYEDLHGDPEPPVDLTSYSRVDLPAYSIVNFVGLTVMFWYSYLPLHLLFAPLEDEEIKS